MTLEKLRELVRKLRQLPRRQWYGPPGYRVAPHVPGNKGSIISCENDHWLYRLKQDAARHRPMRAADIECIDDLMPQPMAGVKVQVSCAYCGQPWRRVLPSGHAQVHFTTGWWPEVQNEKL